MPRARGQKDYISLVRGLITEASPLAFPEGATTAELNFLVDSDGLVRTRRLGFDTVGVSNTLSSSARVENALYWRGPSLVCVIVTNDTPATFLRFHAVDEDFSLILQIQIRDSICVTQATQTTSLLVITTDSGEAPILCKYDKENQQVEINNLSIFIRDFELVDDELSVSTRPAVLSDNHKYNLYNAGWYQTKKNEKNSDTPEPVIDAFKNYAGSYPSNSDVIGTGLIIDTDGNSVFDPEYVDEADFGNSRASRGHYVYNILDIDRDSKLASPTDDGTPSTTLTPVGVANLAGNPSYNPDEPDSPSNPSPPGGDDPYIPPRWDVDFPYELP